MNKRTFLRSSLMGLGSLASLSAFAKMANAAAQMPAPGKESDEDFWASVRKDYRLKSDYINLENGYYCIQPQPVLDKYLQHIQAVNMDGAHYMRTVQFDNKKAAADKLAALVGCKPGEVIITRNTTESLDMVIMGQQWQQGDEAVMAEQDYGAMLDMFRQVAKRYGVVNKLISLPLHPQSDEEIVSLYAAPITPRTKLLMVCHMINITGQILPVRKICDMAHARGVRVMVDGAHCLAHIQLTIPGLGCDYYGCSLHKWLSVPLGAGMLYMKKALVQDTWPIFAEGGKQADDLLRLNHTGTHAVATDLTIPDAIDYYLHIGAGRKEDRLRYLQHYWTSKVRGMPNVLLNTPADQARCCGIANVGIKGLKPADWAALLLQKYSIYTVAIDNAGVQGCRITPNVFTTTAELDVLVQAVRETAA